ncbi:Universal stress protein family, partial [Musa troglodytarum]
AYDFLNTSEINFNVNLWYNSTYSNQGKPRLLRIPRILNMVSNAFLRQFKSSTSRVLLNYVKEMPKAGTRIALDLSELLGPLLYSWVVQLLLPVFLISLVHDKQHMIRIMMKVHGLGDGPYWVITYGHFLSISFLYMLWLATFGSIIGLDIFRLNNYPIQFLFYGLYINLQIVLAFLAGIGFSDVHSAAVVGYIYVFGSGLLGSFLFQFYIEHPEFSRKTLFIMELIPGFSLYRGLYELSQFALGGRYQGTYGMQWKDLSNHDNGIKEVLVIMALEWLILLYVSYYLDQLALARNGACRYSSIFTRNFKNRSIQPRVPIKIPSSTITVDQENSDIFDEVTRHNYSLQM